MPFKKKFRKYAKKATKALGKRYFKGKKANFRNANIGQMARDIYKLKRALNSEKKTVLREERTPITLGLITASNKTSASITGESIYSQRNSVFYSGAYVQPNLIGTLTQGTSSGEIVGEQAKMVSYHMDYRIKSIQGSDTVGPQNRFKKQRTKVRLFLVLLPRGDQVLTDGTTATNDQETLLQRFFEPSVFDDTYDGTRRNIEYMKDFKVLSSKVVYFNHDETNDDHTTTSKFDGIYEGKFGGKLNNCHFRYDGSKIIKNQIALIAIPDAGIVSPSQDLPLVDHFTMEYSFKGYYVDN